jgi:hypothetical protein
MSITFPTHSHTLTRSINANAGLLTNVEVFADVRKSLEGKGPTTPLKEFEMAVRNYVQAHTHPRLLRDPAVQEQFVRALSDRGLTALEIVQAVNFQPRAEVDVHVVSA